MNNQQAVILLKLKDHLEITLPAEAWERETVRPETGLQVLAVYIVELFTYSFPLESSVMSFKAKFLPGGVKWKNNMKSGSYSEHLLNSKVKVKVPNYPELQPAFGKTWVLTEFFAGCCNLSVLVTMHNQILFPRDS